MTINVFISYSHNDGNFLEQLHKHLAVLKREGELTAWDDHAIISGDQLDEVIVNKIERSQIFIALISPDYLASRYCYEKEFNKALELKKSGNLRIVPIILEPCDWLSSPFKVFSALPKDGKPISSFTNYNTGYVDIVTGLRAIIDSNHTQINESNRKNKFSEKTRMLRIKKDFDSIDRSDYADEAFNIIRDYFCNSCYEMSQIGGDIRAKFENMSETAFTCSVINRAKREGGEAHITFHNCKSENIGFGDISYINKRHANKNMSSGSIRVCNDDYKLFLSMNNYMIRAGREGEATTPQQISETLWNEFVKEAGIYYD